MNCKDFEKDILLYIEDGLSEEQFFKMVEHEIICPKCEQSVELYEKIISSLLNLKLLEIPDALPKSTINKNNQEKSSLEKDKS
ncbi:hypothetical protein ACFL6P_00190 [Candidatus Latescibacterota bacterium]